MGRFQLVAPPAWGDAAATPEAVLDSIDGWLGNEPLWALVEAFGGEVRAGSSSEKLDWLDAFSAENWDFRAGQERNLATKAEFDAETTQLILDAAEALQLMSAAPPTRNEYTHVLILGGLVRACLLRPRFAADLVRGGLRTDSVAALSAYRPLRGDENELIEIVGMPGKTNEMEAMEAGLVQAFELSEPAEDDLHEVPGLEYATSLVRTWHKDGVTIRLVIAPSPEPETRRAATPDTYAYWADQCAHIGPGDSILLVTSSIYLPFQHADAVRMLAMPHGCAVETVGIDFSDESLGAMRQPFTPANYLQECRSMIRAVRQLHQYATAMVAERDA